MEHYMIHPKAIDLLPPQAGEQSFIEFCQEFQQEPREILQIIVEESLLPIQEISQRLVNGEKTPYLTAEQRNKLLVRLGVTEQDQVELSETTILKKGEIIELAHPGDMSLTAFSNSIRRSTNTVRTIIGENDLKRRLIKGKVVTIVSLEQQQSVKAEINNPDKGYRRFS